VVKSHQVLTMIQSVPGAVATGSLRATVELARATTRSLSLPVLTSSTFELLDTTQGND